MKGKKVHDKNGNYTQVVNLFKEEVENESIFEEKIMIKGNKTAWKNKVKK